MARQPAQEKTKWTPAWVALTAALAALAVVLVERNPHLHRAVPIDWWGLAPLALFGAVATGLAGLVRQWWARTHAHRAACWVAAGAWTTWVSVAGWSGWAWLLLLGATAILAGLAPLCHTPAPQAPPGTDRAAGAAAPTFRSPVEVRREQLLQQLTSKAVRVTDVVPWERKGDGEQIHVDLPIGMTWRDLAPYCDQIAGALHLPQGCNVRILEGAHQGKAVLDVMLRDCLADPVTAPEDFSKASINDTFAVMWTPRGEPLDMCLREKSMVVGGTTGAGKTTLLHRLILWLARCIDALIWVVDPNGGGVAEPWIGPWARGEADDPIIDWIADDEVEGAVMVAIAAAAAKDRKTSKVAVERKRAKGVKELPVSADLPAIIVLCDEGAEMRQKANLLGQLVIAGMSRVAQIGRAEGARIVMSILRGTADALDKGLRVNAAQRICLRMEEEDEYVHVLGSHPGSTRLIHTGSGYVRRSTDIRPVFARSADLSRDEIERAAVALAPLRPKLDERARLVASRVRVRDVLDGRDPSKELLKLPVMQDVEAGLAYENRWKRYERKLAEMRGEEWPDEEPGPESEQESAAQSEPAAGAEVKPGSGLAWLMEFSGMPTVEAPPGPPQTAAPAPAQPVPSRQIASPEASAAAEESTDLLLAELEAPKLTTRDHIVLILGDVYPEALTNDQLGGELERRAGKAGNRTHRQDLLKDMVSRGQIVRIDDGPTGGRYQAKR